MTNKYIFTWYEYASKDKDWIKYKAYDQQECVITHYPEYTGENYLIQFADGTEIGVEEYEIDKMEF